MDQPVAFSGPVHQKAGAPYTLAIDIGGTRLKAGLLDAAGMLAGEPVRVDTPHNDPAAVVEALVTMVAPLGAFDRVSVGFPGVVRRGVVLTAPNLGTAEWKEFPLAARLQERFDRPVRLLNDASVQGLGVIKGEGLECVITLGTGMGFALFYRGALAPHLEMGQHNARKDKTYDQFVGSAALAKIGEKRWNKRVQKVIEALAVLTTYDVLYIGGGDSKSVKISLPENVKLVANAAGITGGVRLWGEQMDESHF